MQQKRDYLNHNYFLTERERYLKLVGSIHVSVGVSLHHGVQSREKYHVKTHGPHSQPDPFI